MRSLKRLGVSFATVILSILIAASSFAMGQQEGKKSIVLACFGTSYPSALVAITNIQEQVRNAFPGVKVQVAFTSNIIRKIWHD